MPCRTMRVALMLAAVASARPALAEEPGECCRSSCTMNPWRSAEYNPWRGSTATAQPNPWRSQTPYQPQRSLELEFRIPHMTWSYSYTGPEGTYTRTGPTCEVAPAPRPAECDHCVRVGETRTGQFMIAGAVNGSCPSCAPAAAPAPLTIQDVVRISGRDPVTLAPTPGCCSQPTPTVRATAVEVVARSTTNKLHGTWVRELPGAVVGFTFADGDLKAVANVNIDGISGCVTLTADYAVSKDGTVHGVITGADATGCGGDLSGMEFITVAVVAQMFVDQPFAFRVKPTGDGLMLSNVRFPLVDATAATEPGPKMTGLLCGLYKPSAGGKLPTAKALKTSTSAGPGEPTYDGLLDTLGGLFGRQTSVPPCVAGGMTLPSPRYLEHYYPQSFPPDPAFPLPRERANQMVPPGCAVPPPGIPMPMPGSPVMLPPQGCPLPAGAMPCPVGAPFPPPGCPVPAGAAFPYPALPPGYAPPPPQVFRVEQAVPAKSCYVGEWNRTVGPCTIGLSVAANQMTAKGVMPVNGELLRVVLTADCREIREGLVAGVITCAEVESVGGSDQFDSEPGRLRKLIDQPFSCRFQVRGDELIVVDLKVGGERELDAGDLGILAGRYAKGEPKWPTTGKGKKTTTESGVSLGGAVGGAVGKVQCEACPTDAVRVGVNFNPPYPVQSVYAPPGVPPMHAPAPLPEPPVPDKKKGKGKKKEKAQPSYSYLSLVR